MDGRTLLKGYVKGVLNELEGVRDEEGAREFVEGAVGVERVQVLSEGGWETEDFVIVVHAGGPHVEVDGRREEVVGYWGFEEVSMPFTPKAREGYERVRRYLLSTLGGDC